MILVNYWLKRRNVGEWNNWANGDIGKYADLEIKGYLTLLMYWQYGWGIANNWPGAGPGQYDCF